MYREQSPSEPLSCWVECAWSFETRTAAVSRVPPDGCVDILYERGRGLRVVGTMTVEQRFDYAPGAAMTGVRFHPGVAGTFLDVSPAEFTDVSVPLDDLWPRRARELKRQLDDAPSIQEARKLLLDRVGVPGSAMNPVQQAISALTAAHGSADLDEMARHANLSPRQFRRRCLEESGLTPKHLARVLRFRHACRIAQSASGLGWSAVALDAGYCDQSHFIRDFREFMGETPMAVLSNTAEPILA
jgi:AraC-like DNA-binding protein